MIPIACTIAVSNSQPEPTASIQPHPVLQANIEAYNRHDLDALMVTFGPNIELVDLMTGSSIAKGIPAVKAYYEARFKANPKLQAEVIHRFIQGATVFDQERLTGALSTPGGQERPPCTVVVISEITDAKISRVWFVR